MDGLRAELDERILTLFMQNLIYPTHMFVIKNIILDHK